MRIVGTFKPNSFFNADNCDRNLRTPDGEGLCTLAVLSSTLSLLVATELFPMFVLLGMAMECCLNVNVGNSERI
jgi:hypothetical protein